VAASCGCNFSETGTQILPRTFGRVRSHTKFPMACPCAVGFHVNVQLTHASGLTDGTKLCLHPGVTTEFPSGYVNDDDCWGVFCALSRVFCFCLPGS